MTLQDKLQALAEKNDISVDELPKGGLITSGNGFDGHIVEYNEAVQEGDIKAGLELVGIVDRDFEDSEGEESLNLVDFLAVSVDVTSKQITLANENGIIYLTQNQFESLEQALALAKAKL